MKCEYCTRPISANRVTNCEGCGAPLPISHATPEMMYNPRMLADFQMVGPRMNIPINPQYTGRLTDGLFQSAGSAGLDLVKGFYR